MESNSCGCQTHGCDTALSETLLLILNPFKLRNQSNNLKPDMNDLKLKVRKFNMEASSTSKLEGQKAQSVKNVIEALPPPALESLQDQVNSLGWDSCAWTDELLANRKMLPGFLSESLLLGHKKRL